MFDLQGLGGLAIVTLAALATALTTGLGALPFLVVRQISCLWLGLSNAVAAGLMFGASHALVVEGTREAPAITLVGLLVGLGFVALSFRLLSADREMHLGVLAGADAKKAILLLLVMTVHSMAEGVGVGVAFAGGETLAAFITVAIAVHNIPEGLAIALVLVPRGLGVGRAAGWAVFSSLPQPLLAVPAFLLVTTFAPVLPFGLGFAAGAMIWVALGELLADAFRNARASQVASATGVALVAMMAFQLVLKG